jgi:hypothetical protein
MSNFPLVLHFGTYVLWLSFKQAVPEEVWDCGSSVRVLDVCNNSIEAIPQKIVALKSLNVIVLSGLAG